MKKVFLTLTMLLFAFTGVTRANVQQNRADQVIEQGFEDGLGDWTMNHCHSSSGPTSSYGGNTGNYAFRFYYTTNYPQYLISPELDDNDGVNFTFYAARYSSNYPETFKVGYSSTTNDPTEFTWGSEVTCTTLYGAGAYQEYSYDFPAGTKYVSIACTSNDQFYMFVDDITVTATEPAPAPGGIVEVTIGDPTSTTTNQYLPGYTLYDYAISQQIYTADEIGVAGTINTLTMWLKNSSSYARNINVYMKEVEATEFASNTAWESFTSADMVASFTMPNGNATPIEVALDLSTPFEYSGSGSLAICFQDVTGSWSSGLGGVVMDAAGNQAIYAYRDGTVYDPSNVGVNGTLLSKKNVIKLSIATGGGGAATVTTDPATLDLGYRPNGAWMAPYVFDIKSTNPVSVNVLDFSGNYFTYDAEVPASINANTPLEVTLTTGEAEEGEVNSVLTVLYGQNRDAAQFDITAYAYNPVDGDVFEKAIEVPALAAQTPYTTAFPAGMYKNYELPEDTIYSDAVYELNFAQDVLLYAGVEGGNVVLYNQDFNGEAGPMADNYYEYNGPEINPGPKNLWFYYDYTGSNTWYGTSAGGGFFYGYKISTSVIAENELAGLTITTVEAAAREAYPYYCYIFQGGSTPFDGDLIGYGVNENTTALYFFDINLEEPAYISGNEDIWVIMYSESPYAGYCGRTPTDVENGKVWTYNPNSSSPMWSSNTSYTPVIYCNMLELPTGREVNMDLANMSMPKGNGTVSEIAEADGQVMNVARSQMAQNMPGNRDAWTPGFDSQIDAMYVPAGTYYMVAAANESAELNIAIDEVPAPDQVIVISPSDGETNVTYPYLAQWIIPDYTTEMQILLGTQYPPQTVLIDWTDYLVESMFLPELESNQSYFMQVNVRNSAGVTEGEIIAFTTPIDPIEGFTVENNQLYPGDAAVFTWEAPARSFQGYNLYCDGVKINEAVLTATTYTVEDLAYNMDGYVFNVTAVYDAGESLMSDPVTVYMTGNGTVKGRVYDTNTSHPIANATIEFRGTDEYGVDQVIPATANASGKYNAQVLAGHFTPYLVMEGYAEVPGETQNIAYNGVYTNVNIIAHEFYYPLGDITATEQENNTVLVEWAWNPASLIVDFETGDFSQAEFTLPATYPWAITNSHAHEGTYAIKSTCEGIASGSSSIEATVDVPYDAKMGFFVSVSSESNYDKFHFYIDGVEQGQALSGTVAYTYKEYTVSAGTHTYKWEYTKDSSVNSGDDCAYVDDITMYRKDEPLPPIVGATVYDFEDGSMMGWTSLDGDGDGNGWVSSTSPGIYHNSGVNLAGTGHNASQAYVISGSYANQTGAVLYPNNFLVSPTQISAEDGAQIQFFACAQDANYAAEHFGVAVSTTSNTSAAAFTTIQEWTLTAKGVRGAGAEAEHDIRGTRDQGAWYQYTVDLSAYAGQDIWVAIRHFNCSDQFILNIDDITLATGGSKITRDERSLHNYILYRRNLYDGTEVVLNNNISSSVFEYTDAAWSAQPFGIYQWGIQAKYAGYAPSRETRDEITIGAGATTNSYLPTYTYYNYSLTEQIYTAAEIGTAGTINSVSFFNTGAARTRNIAVYMAATDKTGFVDNYDWVNMTAGDKVYEGAVTFVSNDWTTITFSTPFTYNGTSNLVIAVDDNTSTYEQGVPFKADAASSQAIRAYNDYTDYDPSTATTYSGTVEASKNQIKLDITASSGPTPPAADGLSEILWSNVIEKDMESTVTFNVTLNNGQSPVGATVAIVGEENSYNGTIDENGSYEVVVRKGQYDLEVALDGYTTWTLSEEITTDTKVYNITLPEIIAPVEDLYVSPTGWAKWKGGNNGSVNPITPGNDSFTENFEGGLNGWTVITVNTDGGEWIHSDDNLGGYDYTELAHSGTGFAMCYSFVDYVGSFNTDSYLVTPQKYDIVAGSTLTFWADNANDSYPENFSVCVATADNPTASDFTEVWSGGAKGNAGGNDMVRHLNNRYENWRSHEIDLSAYAGQSVYIAFHDVNYDMYEIWIDDVALDNGSKGNRAPLTYKVKIDGVYEGETVNPYFQHNVDGMEPGSTHVTAVRPLYTTGMPEEWMEYEWTYTPCDQFAGVTGLAGTATGTTVNLSWTMPEGGVTPPPTAGQWYYYDNGTNEDAIGTGGGQFWWGVMFPAGSYTGNMVTKVAAYDYMAMTGTVTIYNDGATSPATAVGTANVTMTGSEEFVEVEFTDPVTIDPSKNLWIVYYNASGATYPAAVCNNTGDANGRWVSLDGTTWEDLAGYGLDYTFMVRAYVAQGAKGEVVEISAPQGTGSTGTFAKAGEAKGSRAMWDLEYSFVGTSAGQQGVCTDGTYIYTASWQSAPTGGYTFYKYDLQGNFIEGFNITGATGIRDLTTDGEYFYGTSGGTQIFILDLANKTLVGTINCSGLTSRHISYDPERDGFWSGNWSTLALYSRTGSLIQNGPAPSSAYGSAYYKDADNVEHLFLFCQPNSDCKVYDYNITTGTLGSSVVLDYSATAPGCTGIAGGCFIGAYNGKTCWFGNSQQDPNLIAIYELDGNSGPVPPVPPAEGILGAYVFRDGELVSSVDPTQTNNSFVEEGLEPGEYEYCVRVVYDDYSMSCEVCTTVTVSLDCDPVTDFAAAYYWEVDEFGARLTWTRPNENVVAYDIYVDGLLFEENVPANVTSIDYVMEIGSYEFGIVAKYEYCESEMAVASVEVTSVSEINDNVVIYPNPTNSNVTIEAAGMTHITVVNALGQIVYDTDVDADMIQLSLGQYKAGLYMIRVNTETGVNVQRVTVVK